MNTFEKTIIVIIKYFLLVLNIFFASIILTLLVSSVIYLFKGEWQSLPSPDNIGYLAYSLFCIMCTGFLSVYIVFNMIDFFVDDYTLSSYLVFFDFFSVAVCILTLIFDYTFFKTFLFGYLFEELSLTVIINKWVIIICTVLNLVLRYIPTIIRKKYYL